MQIYIDLIAPLLRLATHKSLRDSMRSYLVNPFYQVCIINHKLSVVHASVKPDRILARFGDLRVA